MRLLRFRVTDFRSVTDSGWIEADAVTALIGTNESGKTNLLLPLWKLKPAKDGEINELADFPRSRYNEIRRMRVKPVFVTAQFELDDKLARRVAAEAKCAVEQVRLAQVARRFDGTYIVGFPEAAPTRTTSVRAARAPLEAALRDVQQAPVATKQDEEPHRAMQEALVRALALLDFTADEGDLPAASDAPTGSGAPGATPGAPVDAPAPGERDDSADPGDADDEVGGADLAEALDVLRAVDAEKASKRSTAKPAYLNAVEALTTLHAEVTVPHPADSAEVRKLVIGQVPSFVYYSNYGNLDSEIYLPHVIENLERVDLGSREEAKARTLKVLFDFVGLSPKEIRDLGRDFQKTPAKAEPTEEEIAVIAEKKKRRDVLLQSASTSLTQKFRAWWKQGEYRFRLAADGDHFRIWVADDRRPEEIELEGRSTGLQWFLSFYLIFLVESEDAHAGAILLLDEPGLSLHPLAQRDLSTFFDQLSRSNQILYTTHSPFMVDPDQLDRVKAVYVRADGTTAVSANLRAAETRDGAQQAQSRSIYPVYAALGLTISDTLLQGCQVVIVEGQSDQHYLSAMKTLLVAAGRLTPRRDLVFLPAGGVSGVNAVVSIVSARAEEPPVVLVDADESGRKLAQQLRAKTYAGAAAERVLSVGDYVGVSQAEVEDLMPFGTAAAVVTKWLRGPEDDFEDVAAEGTPFVAQVEAYAKRFGLTLEQGWKVELAKLIKARLLRGGPAALAPAILDRWAALFDAVLAREVEAGVSIPVSAGRDARR
jgi:energy-coupling factor transporter ATP-binding protein EcfA2